MITQTINLNLIPGSPLPRINVSQYDNGSRTLQFNLYNGVSPYEIPSGASVYIVGTKADNTGFEYACTFDGTLVSVDITDQMTVFAGEVQSELRIVQSDEILGTANFIINVESAALSDDTQISETDIPIIQRIPEILEEAEGYADTAHKWATFGADTETPSSSNNAKYWAEQSQFYAIGHAIASNEPTATSSRAYSVGQYMVRGGNLKKVTRAIASGESITGNNTRNTTVGAELTQINSNLTNIGDIYSASSPASISVPNNTPTNLVNLTLNKGVYIVYGYILEPPSMNTTYMCMLSSVSGSMSIYTGSEVAPSAGGWYASRTISSIVKVTANNSVIAVRVHQTSGSDYTYRGAHIYAVKISNYTD
jgi:hypothetical protein